MTAKKRLLSSLQAKPALLDFTSPGKPTVTEFAKVQLDWHYYYKGKKGSFSQKKPLDEWMQKYLQRNGTTGPITLRWNWWA
jgi:hypothetical protein